MCMQEIMETRLPVIDLVREAWALALSAVRPALFMIAAFAVAGGVFTFALGPGSAIGDAAPAIAALGVFFVGIEFSLVVYRTMLGTGQGDRLRLVHANLAVYIAFLFVGVFIGFFLAVLPGILLEASGRADLNAETPPEEVQAALREMLPTPYGWVLALACLAGAGALAYMAVRLLVFGAATVEMRQTMVFRTWSWTKGHALRIGLATLATHVVPFAVAVSINSAVRGPLWASGAAGAFLAGVLDVLLLVPFILAGHGLAVAVLRRLRPADSAE